MVESANSRNRFVCTRGRKSSVLGLIGMFSVVVSILIAGCLGSKGNDLVIVERAIDGDTFDIAGNLRVRLIGVDTPERTGADAPYGKEAADFTRNVLEGKRVRLVLDVQERDRYGRLLAYVYLEDGTFFNELLVREGYAYVYTVPPNISHAGTFLAGQSYAMERKRGVWSEASVNGELDRLWLGDSGRGIIKGNISRAGEKIYHMPGSQFYGQTKPEVWFKTERDALENGFRKSRL